MIKEGDSSAVVIVTGASRGLGAAIARWLGKHRAGVALLARTIPALEAVAADVHNLGGEPLVIAADVADFHSCRRATEKTLARFGRLTAVVNNAGTIAPIAPAGAADASAWQRNIAVNLVGPFNMVRSALAALRRHRGRIVNISSGAAEHPIEGWSAYCAAKAGLTHFTRVLAAEEPAITPVALRPGVVDTQMQEAIRTHGREAMSEERVKYFIELKKSGRLAPPDVPARAAAWLALCAPRALSGAFVEYDDPRIAEPAIALLGATLQ
jgi:NAD(P)-dependent dehydrogenase (short-subunit alcohol dehydrogenase family)